jgi:hypothetical protein
MRVVRYKNNVRNPLFSGRKYAMIIVIFDKESN